MQVVSILVVAIFNLLLDVYIITAIDNTYSH